MSEMAPELDNSGPDDHIYLTLDDADENQVLELVRVAGPKMYVREDGDWSEIDPEADNERVWDRQIIDVTPEAASVFDQAEESGSITRDLFASVEVPDEEADDTDPRG